MSERKLHVIANSHIDPVWLWNRSSGRCSWNSTMRSAVRLMGEYPELKFTASTTAMYRWIEETDRGLFAEIQALVAQGRWEIVGGWEVESDAIISRPVTLIKQAEFGKRYIRDRFGVDVKVAYNVDSFGHTAGLPTILAETGFDYYVYTRSQPTPVLFRWKAESGAVVTALRLDGYGYAGSITREAFVERLRTVWGSDAERPLAFIGVGDHGGGIYRHHLEWLRKVAQEIPLCHTTMQEYLAGVDLQRLPEISGELGPVFRGCYSACHGVKRAVATGLQRIHLAESLGASSDELEPAWRELLFHHFHDILPGTSVRHAYERDVFAGLGMVAHTANTMIDRELARRDAAVDTTFMTEGGVLAWNPHPREAVGIVAVDGFTDPNHHGAGFNVLRTADGQEIPLQTLPAPTSYGPCNDGWGRLTAVVPMGPHSERYLAYGRSETAYPDLGFTRQQALLDKLSFAVCFDDSRTWGFGLEAFNRTLGQPQQLSLEQYRNGPVVSILRAHYRYEQSTITMDLVAYQGIDEIEIRLRLNWQQPQCCLKLVLNHGQHDAALFTGGALSLDKRPGDGGEYALIDWCAVSDGNDHTGFYAADLHGCDHRENQLRLTLLRPTLYSDHAPFDPATDDGWQDLGQIQLRCWYFAGKVAELEPLPGRAQLRLQNAETHEVTVHAAGTPYRPGCPVVGVASPALVAQVGPEAVYAFNYGATDAAITVDGTSHDVRAKGLKRIAIGAVQSATASRPESA